MAGAQPDPPPENRVANDSELDDAATFPAPRFATEPNPEVPTRSAARSAANLGAGRTQHHEHSSLWHALPGDIPAD